MSNLKSEKELIAEWIRGDERSFDALFTLHFARLHQFALRHTSNTGLAEELAMDTMLKLWHQKDSLHHDAVSLGPLLFRILQSSIIDNYRKRKPILSAIEVLHQEPEGTEKADTDLIVKQLRVLYNEGIKRLSPRQKMVFTMRHDRDMSYRDIAGELELSTKTVDRHLSDAATVIRGHVSKFLSICAGGLTLFLLK